MSGVANEFLFVQQTHKRARQIRTHRLENTVAAGGLALLTKLVCGIYYFFHD